MENIALLLADFDWYQRTDNLTTTKIICSNDVSSNSGFNWLNQDYKKLRDDTAKVEKIRNNVYDILQSESRETQRTRAQDVDR